MLTTGEVAKLFQVSAQTVINWLNQGRMPFERIGRGPRRLTEESVLKYIKTVGISTSALDQTIYSKALKKVFSASSSSNNSVAIINSDMNIIGWNEGVKTITGLSPMDVLGKNITEYIHAGRGDNEIETFLNGTWDEPSRKIEVTHQTKDGKHMKITLTASKFYADGSSVAGFALVYPNLSEEKD
ncbi:MAG: PAS domain-containing protein [Fibrobacteria bacterium]|nr:PAS domain-containing protein [Fibrobacteria bacterium]